MHAKTHVEMTTNLYGEEGGRRAYRERDDENEHHVCERVDYLYKSQFFFQAVFISYRLGRRAAADGEDAAASMVDGL